MVTCKLQKGGPRPQKNQTHNLLAGRQYCAPVVVVTKHGTTTFFLSLLTATFVNEQIKWRLFGHNSGWMSSALGAFLCCCNRESCGRRHYIFELSVCPYLSALHSAVDVLSEWRQHVSHWETVHWNYTCHFTSISLKTHLNIRTMDVYFLSSMFITWSLSY